MMKLITAMQIQESATLKAGQGLAKRTCKLTEKEIDDMTVRESIGQIAQHPGEE